MDLPVKICVVGHSICKHLGEYVESQFFNFDMQPGHISCDFIGVSGLRVPYLFSSEIIDNLKRKLPDVVILVAGDNDIKNNTRPEALVHSLLAAADNISNRVPSVRKVVFSKLLPRHRGNKYYFYRNYNAIACRVNDLLLREIFRRQLQSVRRLFRWELPFPCENIVKYQNSRRTLFHKDGVHLSRAGLKRFAKALKAVMIAARHDNL